MKLSFTLLGRFSLVGLITCLCWVGLGAQTVFYVTESGAGTRDGSSWANASDDLWAVTQTFGPYNEIWVAQGVYKPTNCTNCPDSERQKTFEIRQNKSIIGGFVGNETSKAQASPDNLTILSGDIDGDGQLNNNSLTVVYCNDCGLEASLENLIISDGYANKRIKDRDRGDAGAGLYITGNNGATANPKLLNCTFQNNTATGSGGAVFINGAGKLGQLGNANPEFHSCTFQNNTANSNGGALYASGAGFNDDGTQTLNGSSVLLDRCRFVGNVSRYVSGTGGNSGGAMYATANKGNLQITVRRSLFEANACIDDTGEPNSNGGAVYLQIEDRKIGQLDIVFENTVIFNNRAYAGGGIYGNRSDAVFRNITVTGNTATGADGTGGGIYTNGGTSNIVNSIVYGNTTPNAQSSRTLKNVDATVSISYSLVEANDCDELNSRPTPADPSTVVCGDGMIFNENPIFNFGGEGSLPRLLGGSPAENGGTNERAALPADYDNNLRIDETGTVDMGAFEVGADPLPVELIAFEASPTAEYIQLNWRTVAEIGLEGYRLERSRDGKAFEALSFTNAAQLGAYSYTDYTALPRTIYYYRLVSVDFDGTTYTSDLVSAELGIDDGVQLVQRTYPNPSAGNLTVHLSSAIRGGDLNASLYDGLGREVRSWSEGSSVGALQLDLSGFADGMYSLRVARGGRSEVVRVLIRH